jgi:hypothetical protein
MHNGNNQIHQPGLPIRCRYRAMTSARSNSRASFLAEDNDLGRDDLTARVGVGKLGGAWTGWLNGTSLTKWPYGSGDTLLFFFPRLSSIPLVIFIPLFWDLFFIVFFDWPNFLFSLLRFTVHRTYPNRDFLIHSLSKFRKGFTRLNLDLCLLLGKLYFTLRNEFLSTFSPNES